MNKSLKVQKSNSAYCDEYRCFFLSQIGKKVYGNEGDVNSIYEIEGGHGMGLMSYVYFKNDIDNHHLVLSSLNFNDIGYTIKDKEENEIEHYKMDSDKVAKMIESNKNEFDMKQNEIFKEAKRKAFEVALNIRSEQ